MITLKVKDCTQCCSGNRAALAIRLRDPSLSADGCRYISSSVSVDSICGGTSTYLVTYDETQLADPTAFLTADDFDLVCIDANAEYAIERGSKTMGSLGLTVKLDDGPADPVTGQQLTRICLVDADGNTVDEGEWFDNNLTCTQVVQCIVDDLNSASSLVCAALANCFTRSAECPSGYFVGSPV